MTEYQLNIKQVVDHPRCRIYRQLLLLLNIDRNIRTSGGSGLFYYLMLCSNAGFYTTSHRVDGINYTIYPGEWICTVTELSTWFRTRCRKQTLGIMEELQKRHLISYWLLDRDRLIKYKVQDWENQNMVLSDNCPCQKDTGYFFVSMPVETELLSAGKCSEMDILIDMWMSAIYNDNQVDGSETGPVVYFRDGSGYPAMRYSDMAIRWGITKRAVRRILNRFEKLEYIHLTYQENKKGILIYLNDYLSALFQLSDVMIDKEEVALILSTRISLEKQEILGQGKELLKPALRVSEKLTGIPDACLMAIVRKVTELLDTYGLACFLCSKALYELYPLQEPFIEGNNSQTHGSLDRHIGMKIICENGKQLYNFELILSSMKRRYER